MDTISWHRGRDERYDALITVCTRKDGEIRLSFLDKEKCFSGLLRLEERRGQQAATGKWHWHDQEPWDAKVKGRINSPNKGHLVFEGTWIDPPPHDSSPWQLVVECALPSTVKGVGKEK